MRCPRCDADITDSHQDDESDVGIVGGWYCSQCDVSVMDGNEDEPELDFE